MATQAIPPMTTNPNSGPFDPNSIRGAKVIRAARKLGLLPSSGLSTIPLAEAMANVRAYCPHDPWPKQRLLLGLNCGEIFFGGAAGGSKTDALAMCALRYVSVPNYSCLILRRDTQRLALPNAIMDRMRQWCYSCDVSWNAQQKTLRFPAGSVIQFGFIDNPDDRFRYASAEFQTIIFEELTEFRLASDEANPYLFMFSRLRRTDTNPVPLQIISASNPGNIGHSWVKERFLTADAAKALSEGADDSVFYKDGRAFIPSRIKDNPAINPREYEASLMHLPAVTRARLMDGDWSIQEAAIIRPEMLRYYSLRGNVIQALNADGTFSGAETDERQCTRFATVDTAGTTKDKANEKSGRASSWSVCAVWDYWQVINALFLRYVWRDRVNWDGLKSGVRETCREWNCQPQSSRSCRSRC